MGVFSFLGRKYFKAKPLLKPIETTIIFHPTKIEFKHYDIPVASVASEPILESSSIKEILLRRWPPEIVTKAGEVLFIPSKYKAHLDLFARVNEVPLVEKQDVWSLLCEPFLDTEFDDSWQQTTLKQLNESGFTSEEISAIRKKISFRMNGYVFATWEWIHLGQQDVLSAFGVIKRGLVYNEEKNRNLYQEFNAIGIRGRVVENYNSPLEKKVDSGISDLTYDIFPMSFKEMDEEEKKEKIWRQRRCLSDKLSSLIVSHYSEPHRKYHDLNHVLKVAEYCKSLAPPTSEEAKNLYIPLQLAAWFHDIIYNPESADNEEQSATLMRRELQNIVSLDDLNMAKKLILMTKNHLEAASDYEKILSDADLSILGEEDSVYTNYRNAIRSEYAHLDNATYNAGRIAFLIKMLNHIESQRHLYHYLHPLHEAQALKNLKNELSQLNPDKLGLTPSQPIP